MHYAPVDIVMINKITVTDTIGPLLAPYTWNVNNSSLIFQASISPRSSDAIHSMVISSSSVRRAIVRSLPCRRLGEERSPGLCERPRRPCFTRFKQRFVLAYGSMGWMQSSGRARSCRCGIKRAFASVGRSVDTLVAR